MFKLNLFAISGLLIFLIEFPLFFFLVTTGKTKFAKVYSLHILTILSWGISAFLIALTKDKVAVISLWKIGYILVLFIPVFFYHSIELITSIKNPPLLIGIYLQACIFTFLTLTNSMILSEKFAFNEFYMFNGSGLYNLSVVIWQLVVALAHINLMRFIKNQGKNERKSLYMFFLFTAIGFVGGTVNFLPGFGINVYPYGNLLIPIHSFGIAYAIMKYRLFDVDFAYKKSIVYSTLFTIITLVYTSTVISLERSIQIFFGYNSATISIIIAFLIGILFIPLRNIIQVIVDKNFALKSPSEILTENERLRAEIAQTEKLKSIATFASGMAHEIKNPLTSIKIFCEYLPHKANDPEFLEKFIPIVNHEANRINELVHDLLEYAKPTPPQLLPADIHKIIEGVLENLSTLIVSKKIELFREYSMVDSKNIAIDSKQIKQALLNILLNAVESMTDKGSLRIRTEFMKNDRKMIIEICDSGCGIHPEDLPHIFDPFFTKKDKGTGLGLSITHGIIKEHGGKIFVNIALGEGSTFRIELPARDI